MKKQKTNSKNHIKIRNKAKKADISREETAQNSGTKKRRGWFNEFKIVCDEAGLSWKKEIAFDLAFSLGVLALGAAFSLLLKSLILTGISLLLSAAIFCFAYRRPKRILRSWRKELVNEFPRLLSFFRLFVSNGRSVYVAFEECRPYASDRMRLHLETLLRRIDVDKSIAPYLSFAEEIGDIEVRQCMVAIYDLSLDGGALRLAHFETLFSRLSEEQRNASFDRFQKRLQNLNLLPLLSGGFAMALVALAVVAIMGDSFYGI